MCIVHSQGYKYSQQTDIPGRASEQVCVCVLQHQTSPVQKGGGGVKTVSTSGGAGLQTNLLNNWVHKENPAGFWPFEEPSGKKF